MRKGTKVMRLTKGRKVEVFCISKTIPNGCWRPAQIVCGNGCTYSVKYNPVPPSPENNIIIDNAVPRKMIRPLPPVDNTPVKWTTGDLAEVFLRGTWKVAKVMAFPDRMNFCFVLQPGQTRETVVRKYNMRQRQMWSKNKWIPIKKDEILVFNEVAEELQVVPNKVKLRQSESTASSTGSCSTSGRSPFQYPDFSRCDDDAESVIVPETRSSIYESRGEVDTQMSTVLQWGSLADS